MIGATFCSGIGAPEMAAPWVDWRFASEIAPFPREVLQQRFGYTIPADHNQGAPLLWDDMAEVTPELLRSRGIPLPDLIVAGTPCQAFSVAGARKGLADKRGNLTLTFVEILHAIADARPDGKLACLWENVPGVLSDKGNAFGCFLGGIVGAVDALPCPADGSWPSEGMVEGPRARAAWCVLDAQWFGVAQRRRRVFVVVDFGNCVDPAAVLLEPDRLRGNSAPRREAGQGAARRAAEGVAIRGRDGGGTAELTGPISTAIRASQGGGDKAHVITSTGDVAHSLRGEGFDASEDGTGRGTPLVPVARGITIHGTDGTTSVASFTDVAGALRARTPGSQENSSTTAVYAPTHAVRRLIPKECARLQGFPDDHTAVPYRGKPASDGPQYKALGNSMAVPVIAWIMERMRISMEDMA